MLVRIIKTELIEKPKYKAIKATFKNLDTGKVASSNVVNFGDQLPVFEVLQNAEANATFNVKVVKQGDYFNWVGIEAAEAPAEEPATAPAAGRRGTTSSAREWEDASERALRQILIVRQSSVAAILSSPFGQQNFGQQKDLDTVLKLAEVVENWVFRDLKATTRPVNVADAMKELLAMKNDVPV